MAGDWLKFEKSTSDKPEVWAMAEKLGIDPDAVVGKLLRVWGWFDEQSEEGNAPSVSKMLLDRRVGVTGFAILWFYAAGCRTMEIRSGFLTLNGTMAKPPRIGHLRQKEWQNTRQKVTVKVTVPALLMRYLEKRREEKRRVVNIHPLSPPRGIV